MVYFFVYGHEGKFRDENPLLHEIESDFDEFPHVLLFLVKGQCDVSRSVFGVFGLGQVFLGNLQKSFFFAAKKVDPVPAERNAGAREGLKGEMYIFFFWEPEID